MNCTEAERIASILRGFHGLQIYADMFWFRHLLAYCDLLSQHRRQFSSELLAQLQLLLRFRKEGTGAPNAISRTRIEKDATYDSSLEALNHSPEVKRLVSDVLVFRANMKRKDTSDGSPDSKFLTADNFDFRVLILGRNFLGFMQSGSNTLQRRPLLLSTDG
jgi:hypothetical protein